MPSITYSDSQRLLTSVVVTASSVLLYVALIAIPRGGWIAMPCVFAAIVLCIALKPRFESYLLVVFLLIAWFPEFSQTDWDVQSSTDFPSLYNYKLIPSLTVSVFDYIFTAIVIVWLIKYVVPRPRRLLEVPLGKVMLAFFAVWLLNLAHGLLKGNETYYALREFRVDAYFVLTYLMFVSVCSDFRVVQRFIKLSIAMGFLIGCYGVVRYLLGIGKEFADVRILFYDIADSMVIYIAMILIAGFAIEGLLKRRAFLTAVLLLPMIFTFLFSFRRGAWVAFAVALLFLVFSYPQHRRLRRLILTRVVVPGVVLLGVLSAIPILRSSGLDFVMARIGSIADVTTDSSNVFRVLDAMNAFTTFLHHPIVGVGAGGRYDIEVGSSSPELMQFIEQVSNASHDGYLYILFKTGLFGFLVYLSIFYQFLKQWFKARNLHIRPLERASLMALGAIVVAFLVNNITEPVSDTLRPSLLLAFAMGWTIVLIQHLRVRAPGLPGVSSVES